MRVISLHQPWATLMALGFKTIETRGYGTKCRGQLAIHAAKTIPAYAVDAIRNNRTIREILLRAYPPEDGHAVLGFPKKSLPLGKILCVVSLDGCVEMKVNSIGQGQLCNWDEMKRYASPSAQLTIEWDLGNWADGRYAWITSNLRHLKNPIEASGKQGFWNYDTDAIMGAL